MAVIKLQESVKILSGAVVFHGCGLQGAVSSCLVLQRRGRWGLSWLPQAVGLLEEGHRASNHLWLDYIVFPQNSHTGAPGWLGRLGVALQLRSWSHGSWLWVPRQALCWQLRAWILLQMLCLPLSAPPLFVLCLSLSNKTKQNKTKQNIKKKDEGAGQMVSNRHSSSNNSWNDTTRIAELL